MSRHDDQTTEQVAAESAGSLDPVEIGPAGGLVHVEDDGLAASAATYRPLVVIDHGSGVHPGPLASLSLPREDCVAIAQRSMGAGAKVVSADPLVVHLEPQPVATVRVRAEWGSERVVVRDSVAATVLSLVSRRLLDIGASGTLHGGAVADGLGRAALLLARSGTGKSTLVAHLVGRGFDLVSDEQVVVDGATGKVHSFTRPVVAKVGGIEALPAGVLPAEAVAEQDDSPGPLLLSAASLGGGHRLVAEPVLVVILDRAEGNRLGWERLGFGAAMEALCVNNLDLSRDPVVVLEAFARLVENAAVVRLSYEHASEAAGAIEELLSEPGPPSGGPWVIEVDETEVDATSEPNLASAVGAVGDGAWSWGSTVRVWSCGELLAYEPHRAAVVSVNAAGADLLWDLAVLEPEISRPGQDLVVELVGLGFLRGPVTATGGEAR